MEIDKIKKALLVAYIGDVGCTLSNADCNDITKYMAGLELHFKFCDVQLSGISGELERANRKIIQLESHILELRSELKENDRDFEEK